MSANQSQTEPFDLESGRTLVSRARHAIGEAAHSEDEPTVSLDPPSGALTAVRGVFVTIKRGERLRGCIGRPTPEQPIGSVVTEAAIDAALHDPRVSAVEPGELGDVTVSVSVLSPPEPLPTTDPEHVDVGTHGLLVERGRVRGLLLPQVAIDQDFDAETFLDETCRKAGLSPGVWRQGDVTIKRFTGQVFTETAPRGTVVERPLGQPSTGSSQHDTEPRTDGGTVREPAVAGEFYADDPDTLRAQLRESFAHEIGPGPLAEQQRDAQRPIALVAPHAGYPYSGPVAARSYATLAGQSNPETAIVLGPNHRRVGPDVAVAPSDRWRTPLGEVSIDRELAQAIVDDATSATFDAVAHEAEHAIEVQVPFLQYVLSEVSIVPICLGAAGHDRAESLGVTLASAIDRTDRDVVVVSSTDLTHYQTHDAAREADRPIREAIETLDTDAIAQRVASGHSMCGPWATVATLRAARERGVNAANVLTYATSADTAGSPERVVGYCSSVIR